MAERRNYVALDWISAEIDETLKQACQALEAYAQDQQDITRLRFCMTYINQVHGTLRMVELHGAALFAGEIELLIQDMLDGNSQHADEAVAAIMAGILYLPTYLKQVRAARKDAPGMLLQRINDMRAMRDADMMTEAAFFNPELSVVTPSDEHAAQIEPEDFQELVDELKQQFQLAFVGIVRNKQLGQNIEHLAKICRGLQEMSQGKRRQSLWCVAIAIVEGLANQSIHPNATVKSLLKEIDSELKSLQQHGAASFDRAVAPEVLKNFLYYIARSDAQSPNILAIQNRYQLKEALAQSVQQGSAGADPDALRSVVAVLLEELTAIKDYLDLHGRGNDQQMDNIRETLPLIKRVGDTMAVLDFNEPAARVRAQNAALEQFLQAGNSEDRDSLLAVAEAIIAVEEDLQRYVAHSASTMATAGQSHVESARETLLLETRSTLERVKESIIDFVASQWDHSRLEQVPAWLHELSAGLDMVGLERAALVLDACRCYLNQGLLQDRKVPEWQMLDKLADAISAVDYFLERVAEDALADNEDILDIAAQSVAELGYDIQSLADARANSGGSERELAPMEQAAVIDEALDESAASNGETSLDPEEPALQQPSLDDETASAEPVPGSERQPIAEATALAFPVAAVTEEPLDEEIAEIFVEEAGEVLESIEQLLPQWQSQADSEAALVELRRAYHTLKGSGRMVGANMLGELAWSIENMLNRIVEQSIDAASSHYDLVAKVSALVPDMVSAFEQRQPVNKTFVDNVMAMGHTLAEGDAQVDLSCIDPQWLNPLAQAAVEVAIPEQIDGDESLQPVEVESGSETAPAGEEVADSSAAAGAAEVAENTVAAAATTPRSEAQGGPLDPSEHGESAEASEEERAEKDALLEIFDAEAEQHLTTMQEFILHAEASTAKVLVSDGLQRALHTLKGSARMAGVDALVSIVTPLEQLIKQLQTARVPIDQEIVDVIRDATRLAFIGLQFVKDKGECAQFSETQSLIARIDHLAATRIPSLSGENAEDSAYLARVGEFMLDTADNLVSISAILARWRENPEVDESDWFIVTDYTSRIASGAAELELEPVAGLSLAWSRAASRLADSVVTGEMLESFDAACGSLESMLDCIAADQSLHDIDAELMRTLEQLEPVAGNIEPASETESEPEPEPEALTESELAADSTAAQTPVSEETMAEPAVVDSADIAATADAIALSSEESIPVTPATTEDDVDGEMIEIFMEEARDLLESIDDTIHQWLEAREDRACFELLQRSLHTLKGGARLTGLRSLGNLSHNFETFLMSVDERGLPFEDNFFARVQRYQDQVVSVVEQVMAGQAVADIDEQDPEALLAGLEPLAMMDVPASDQQAQQAESSRALAPEPAQARVTHEAVKVSAQLIEELVNLAGETSINRGRVEEQISEIMYSLAEMDATMDRMQEQLRRLDIETEQQLIFRQEQVEILGLEEFDPLEMDRYSVLQQLSRSLQESSSDIREVKGSIFHKARDMETLLLQQSRINTDLQEGLMRSRMVPFGRLVPRLRRIVRQVSVELNKNVNLEFFNTEGEMDRTILERMVPPFEHMLRNAVDHGIESEADRSATNKPPVGTISISLAREAGDVVITLADDGRGIDLAAVRRKAIERGMMAADASLSDHDVLQFILQSGFSTAQSVTQISGRGVGLDVVASEIKQIGGSVDIESNQGRGTRFVVRLPFTVSVNRALMVQTCGETYALPLNTIEGIMRVSPFELESYYQPDAPLFEYAGQAYKLRYMGALIRKKAMPDLEQETMPLPVILVRSGEHAFAIQVDSLLGSREIVVKTLGPQFSSVQGLSGATVLGDGGVVVILDLHAMIRTDVSQPQHNEIVDTERESEKVEENRNLLVMVVDDSVTVRKVTSRFLERNGMDVLLAKDGVDAMQLLQDHKPDVMLLDIEMPRMDGFEVASRVKHSSKLRNLPIIMITSRTGEKHRLRAESIGVDKYLGKPYQELELLGNIQELTGYSG